VNKQNIGTLKSNSNQKLLNGMYSINCENFFKNIIVFYFYRGGKFKKVRFFEKNVCFTAPLFYMQLTDCGAIYRWKELFKRKRMTYYMSIYVFIL